MGSARGSATQDQSVTFSPSVASSSMVNSSVVTLPHSVDPSKLNRLVGKLNKSYERRRYLRIVSGAAAAESESKSQKESEEALSMSLTPPLPIRGERSRLTVASMIQAGLKNRAPECQLYLPSENKFLCVVVDFQTGLHTVKLLEGHRFFPSRQVALWRLLPADRTSKDKRLLLQNIFSSMFLGHDRRGAAQCNEPIATPHEHLDLQVDEETGLLRIVCPHWHWERGAPLVVKGEGKRNPSLWPTQTKFLEDTGKFKHSENPGRTLRCGYGGAAGGEPSKRGYVPALFQVVWDLPPHSKRPINGQSIDDLDQNWLGQKVADYSFSLNSADSAEGTDWRSPYKARQLGLLP
eukprot:CAMPEP_0171709286 /NCGR_PEP_ID=MMETSP0991-20121206/15387_1 /TAXON_ID=483369 /ORGANISM="non described non described, Strain CCMP2098" /LENGTH=349 /DNA_ID=CAMNT_0012299363 /DNA_START=85 /DNA_END=1134 /DNA_ORIENTATION=-